MNQVLAGRIMLGIAIVALVTSIVATLVARQTFTDLDAGIGQSLELTVDVLETVDESFELADEALRIVTVGVGDAEGAVRSLSGSMAEGQAALDTVTALARVDIADALESVEQALPAIQTAAVTIDETLSTLGSLPFGPSYNPDQPLGETIGELGTALTGLPDELREQAEQVERTSEELAEATRGTVATADALLALEGTLTEATDLIGAYERRTAEARQLVGEQRDVISASAARARLVVTAFGTVFAFSQFVPLYLGLGLTSGAFSVREP